MSDHGGVLNELVAGIWEEPGTGRRHGIPIGAIVIRDSLDGVEAELVAAQHDGQRLCVVCDEFTHGALGGRVHAALNRAGQSTDLFVWRRPVCSERGVEEVRAATAGADALIAVGSGTVNDSVKYASWQDGKTYSVFATSPMNAFTTSTASVSFDGFKKSITCHGANGVFFDLDVLARCPPRLVSAAFADVICRTTAQVDWLLSHLLFDTRYTETPYHLLAIDEPGLIEHADALLDGDHAALGRLTRISAIMGLGTNFTETTHSGSMAEHMISHYIDMFAGDDHPGTSHGEQVGVATITMSQLHNRTLTADRPPMLRPTEVPVEHIEARYPTDVARNMIEQTRAKSLDAVQADALNEKLDVEWPAISSRLSEVMLPFDRLHDAMQRAGCQITATDLGLDPGFYREAVTHARFIRDRFSMLDLVDDSIGLEGFVNEMPA